MNSKARTKTYRDYSDEKNDYSDSNSTYAVEKLIDCHCEARSAEAIPSERLLRYARNDANLDRYDTIYKIR